ncbi:MAG: hypothetical protein ACI4RA_02195 [Kiritimatiellia bacterium]
MKLALTLGCLAVVGSTAAGGFSFDASTGALSVEQNGQTLWRSGPHGLWRIRFRDGSFLSAADFATNAVSGGSFKYEANGTRLVWTSPVADVAVTAEPATDGASTDLRAEVTPKRGESLMLDFPAHLTFPAATVKDFVYPGRGNSGPGLALNAKFFLPASPESPHGWTHAHKSGAGYAHLYGGGLKMQPMESEPAPLSVTPEGEKWFRPGAVRQINRWKRPVIRPPAPGQSDLVLIDSPLGPYLSAKRFGGSGALWRFGVADASSDRIWAPPAETYAVRQLLPRLIEQAPARRKVALIALSCGPSHGGFVRATVKDWRAALQGALPPGCVYEEITTIPALRRATAARDHLLVLNPYGEAFPVDAPENYLARLDDLRAFVKAGGNWFEVGGYSFFSALHGGRFLKMVEPYPPLFADFAQLTTASGGSVALYGVQPRPAHAPWRNPVPFTPGETGVGADDDGGWFFHAFAAYARPHTTVRTPRVRIRIGATLDAALADYAAANTLTLPLAEKIARPGALEAFKKAPLLHIHGTAADVKRALAACPVPTLYHPSNYLKGGFDKEYPDHLPPNPSFGTADELADLFRFARARGHLVSPYTNPTWWCDHPRGPSFIAAGEAPLAIGLDGKPYHERYSKNDGWTITFWHPAVQAANRKTVREFTRDYPVDLLFQDQCGARGWRWDFNPASPSPMAYTEGLVSMNEEDSRIVPLGTEDGWDQVANRQAVLCGCSWRVVPLEGLPPWRDQFKDVIPADAWRIEPVALRLFHDKALFFMHDLGAFVRNDRTLAWMFALGYNLSLNGGGGFEKTDAFKWYEWLHVLQSRVVSRIAGQPLVAYHHDRAPLLARKDLASLADPRDDGVVTARWGDVSVAVNLGERPRTVAGRRLAPYGWWVEGPRLRAGRLDGEFAFVEAEDERWVHAPDPAHAPVRPTEAQRTQPPCVRADAPRTLGVIDFGPKVHGSWVKCSPADWFEALAASPLATRHGLAVTRIKSHAELAAALHAPSAFFAIVNPYGEVYPAGDAGDWHAALAAIRDYVAHGGHWVETGSASFYVGMWLDAAGAPRRARSDFGGVAHLGLDMQMDDIDEPPTVLQVLPQGRNWLPTALQNQVAASASPVNRGLRAGRDTPVTPLIGDAEGRVWFGFHQLGGWGSLWRFGGANPTRDLALRVVPAALEHAFTTPPPPVPETTRLRVRRE